LFSSDVGLVLSTGQRWLLKSILAADRACECGTPRKRGQRQDFLLTPNRHSH